MISERKQRRTAEVAEKFVISRASTSGCVLALTLLLPAEISFILLAASTWQSKANSYLRRQSSIQRAPTPSFGTTTALLICTQKAHFSSTVKQITDQTSGKSHFSSVFTRIKCGFRSCILYFYRKAIRLYATG